MSERIEIREETAIGFTKADLQDHDARIRREERHKVYRLLKEKMKPNRGTIGTIILESHFEEIFAQLEKE